MSLRDLCKAHGALTVSARGVRARYVWDYAADDAVPQSEMPIGSARWRESERVRFGLLKTEPRPEPAPKEAPEPRQRHQPVPEKMPVYRAILQVLEGLQPVATMVRRDDLWTHEQDVELLRLIVSGSTNSEAAERMTTRAGVNRQMVGDRLARIVKLYG